MDLYQSLKKNGPFQLYRSTSPAINLIFFFKSDVIQLFVIFSNVFKMNIDLISNYRKWVVTKWAIYRFSKIDQSPIAFWTSPTRTIKFIKLVFRRFFKKVFTSLIIANNRIQSASQFYHQKPVSVNPINNSFRLPPNMENIDNPAKGNNIFLQDEQKSMSDFQTKTERKKDNRDPPLQDPIRIEKWILYLLVHKLND